MRNTFCRILFAWALIFYMATFAFASYVDLDPDNFASGTVIPRSEGAYMCYWSSSINSLIDGNGYFTDYYARNNFLAHYTYSVSPIAGVMNPSTFSRVYGASSSGGSSSIYSSGETMHVLFGSYDSSQGSYGRFLYQPTNYASIDVLWPAYYAGGYPTAYVNLRTYGAGNSLLGTYHYDNSGSGTFSNMSIYQDGIYRISVTPYVPNSSHDNYGLDNLGFVNTSMGTVFDLAANQSINAPNGMILGGSDSLTGVGAINGSLSNNGGLVSPGHSPGTIIIDGDFTQDANGRTVMEIGSDENDKLEISGQATFNGTLEILLDGFDCVEDEVITLMTYGSFAGQFSEVLGLDFAGGSFELAYGDSALTLQAKCPVPLPAAAWFLLSGLIGLLGFRKRL